MKKRQIIVNEPLSEKEEKDFHYYASLTPDERMEIMHEMMLRHIRDFSHTFEEEKGPYVLKRKKNG